MVGCGRVGCVFDKGSISIDAKVTRHLRVPRILVVVDAQNKFIGKSFDTCPTGIANVGNLLTFFLPNYSQ